MENLQKIKQKKWFSVIIGIGILFILYIFLTKDSTVDDPLDFQIDESMVVEDIAAEERLDSESQEEQSSTSIIYAEIKGAVLHPGVYQLEDGNRLFDLINLAGGLTEEAEPLSVNQAMIVTDQMSLYVQTKEEWQTIQGESYPSATNLTVPFEDGSTINTQSTLININTADVTELEQLSGIGPKKAEAIIQYREEHGSYQIIEDLMNVSGIGQKTFDKLADDITVGP